VGQRLHLSHDQNDVEGHEEKGHRGMKNPAPRQEESDGGDESVRCGSHDRAADAHRSEDRERERQINHEADNGGDFFCVAFGAPKQGLDVGHG
jgi:hypothetical protein